MMHVFKFLSLFFFYTCMFRSTLDFLFQHGKMLNLFFTPGQAPKSNQDEWQCTQWACSQRNKSHSKSLFGSRSASWFELRAFTCIANAVPITNKICALRGNILFLLCSPRWLTHAWLQRAFAKCTRTNHVTKELCVHIPQNQAFQVDHDPKRHCFRISKAHFKSSI